MALLAPAGAGAQTVVAAGSVTIIGNPLAQPLFDQLVGVVVTSNPGLDKTITQQLPQANGLFVAPFIVVEPKVNPGPSDIGSTLVLTNVSGGLLTVSLIFRNLDGTVRGTVSPLDLQAFETKIMRISELLP
jgi:hypothetical protein